MKTTKAPCKGCQDRWMSDDKTCHSECKKYKLWKEQCIEEKKQETLKIRLDKDSYSTMESMSIRKSTKAMQCYRKDKK